MISLLSFKFTYWRVLEICLKEWSHALKEGNKHFLNDDFKNSDKTDGSAKLKFSIDEIDETSVHIIGEGKIKVKSIEKFKFLMDGELTKYTVNNQTIYFGPVIAEAKNEKNIVSTSAKWPQYE